LGVEGAEIFFAVIRSADDPSLQVLFSMIYQEEARKD